MYQPKDSTGISKSLFTFFAIVIVVWNIIDFAMGKGILIDKKKIVLLEPQDNDSQILLLICFNVNIFTIFLI